MGVYTVVVNTDDIKRSDEAIKIEFVARIDRLSGLGLETFNSPEDMMAGVVHDYVSGLVAQRFTSRRIERITAALADATDEQVEAVAQDLKIDLSIDVPA